MANRTRVTASGLYKRKGRKPHYAKVKDARGKWVEKSFGTDKRTAEAMLARYRNEAELSRAGLTDVLSMDAPLEVIRDRYVVELRTSGKSAQHVERVERSWRRLFAAFPSLTTVRHLATDIVLGFRSSLVSHGLSHGTVNNAVGHITGALRWAEACQIIGRNPVGQVKRLDREGKHRRRVRRALTPAEIEKLIAAGRAEDERLYRRVTRRTPLMLILIETGMRRNEAASLRWEDIVETPDGFELRVRAERTKTDEARSCPISGELAAEILGMRSEGAPILGRLPRDDDPVFPSREGGGLTGWALRDWLHRVIERSGVPIKTAEGVVDFHTFRTTLATDLVREGVDHHTVMAILGHRDPTMVRRYYADLELSPKRRAAEQVLRRRREEA
ncbi:MAG: tyrosine-type recombinase/integrase [Gemmatimonadetes bacterium]|nr:tyrosine-type recombinase/integrase [Gemmatimonadota bacterium]